MKRVLISVFIILMGCFVGCSPWFRSPVQLVENIIKEEEDYVYTMHDIAINQTVVENERLQIEDRKKQVVRTKNGVENVEYHVTFSIIGIHGSSQRKVFSETDYNSIIGNADILETVHYKLNIDVEKLKLSMTPHLGRSSWSRFSVWGDENFSQEEIDTLAQEILDNFNNM